MTTPRLTKRQAAIIGAFTGITAGPFSDVQKYAQELLGRPIFTHEFGTKYLAAEIKEKARQDFYNICHERDPK